MKCLYPVSDERDWKGFGKAQRKCCRYWKSFLTADAVVQANCGNVAVAFEACHCWYEKGAKESLEAWLT